MVLDGGWVGQSFQNKLVYLTKIEVTKTIISQMITKTPEKCDTAQGFGEFLWDKSWSSRFFHPPVTARNLSLPQATKSSFGKLGGEMRSFEESG